MKLSTNRAVRIKLKFEYEIDILFRNMKFEYEMKAVVVAQVIGIESIQQEVMQDDKLQ